MSHVNTSLALFLLILLPMVATATPARAQAVPSDGNFQQAVDAGAPYFAPSSVSQATMEEVIVRGFVSACANKGGGLCDTEYGWGMVVREIVQSSPSCPMKILDTAWVQIEEPEPTIASDIRVLMWLEVYGYCSPQPENQRWPYLIQLWSPNHYAKAIAAPSQPCSEGAVKILETCPDGQTWSHRQVCRNNVWVDEYQECPRCSEGAVRNVVMCPDGINWKQREVCRNNNWVPESQRCTLCSEGAINVLETCPDGSWKHRQVCRNNAWQDEYQNCRSCPDGQYWNGAQCVCPSGQEWNGQQCVTPQGAVEIRDAKLVQAVYDVPMIANKPTVLYARLHSSSQTEITTDVTIKFGNTVISELGLQVLPEDHDYWLPEKGRYFVFETPGAYNVVLEIRPRGGNEPSLLADYTVPAEVISTKGFSLVFIPVGFPSVQAPSAEEVSAYCAGSPVGNGDETSPADFIREIFPVPLSGDHPFTIACAQQPLLVGMPPPASIDILNQMLLSTWVRDEAKKRGYDYGIGVLRQGAISFNFLDLDGFAWYGGVVIEHHDSPWIQALLPAHELGHIFHLCHNDGAGCPNKEIRATGFEVILGLPTDCRWDCKSLMCFRPENMGDWITREDYLQLIEQFRDGLSQEDELAVAIAEEGHKLLLHVYDPQGRHVGFSDSVQAPEVAIPGAMYLDTGKVIMITVPLSTGDVRIVVDASKATQPQEDYTLLCVAVAGERTPSYVKLRETISSGEAQEYSPSISGTTVASIQRVTWLGRYYPWIVLGVLLAIATGGVGVYASRRKGARRKASSTESRPRVKEIRSTTGRPRVKSIEETGKKPRVLRVDEK